MTLPTIDRLRDELVDVFKQILPINIHFKIINLQRNYDFGKI